MTVNIKGFAFAMGEDGELEIVPENTNKVHELKILPEHFEAVRIGVKTFEVRKNDRDFKVGDLLILKEWDSPGQYFTGRDQRRKVSYILDDERYVKEGYVILAFDWQCQ